MDLFTEGQPARQSLKIRTRSSLRRAWAFALSGSALRSAADQRERDQQFRIALADGEKLGQTLDVAETDLVRVFWYRAWYLGSLRR